MLIVIDKSLVDQIDTSKRDNIVNALQEIAMSYMKGAHLVFGSYDVLAKLRNNSLLSSTAQKAYARLHDRCAQLGPYLNAFSHRLEIVADDDVFESTVQNNVKVFRVSARHISEHHILSPTILLAENLLDTVFYLQLARAYVAKSKFGNIKLECEQKGGGGSTVAPEYKYVLEHKSRLCLCIVDGDTKYAGDGYGDTAKALVAVSTSAEGLCEYLILQVRDIENLIPYQLLSEVINGNEQRCSALEKLERLKKLDSQSIRFYDIKEGLLLKEIVTKPNSEYTKYWSNHLRALGITQRCFKLFQCDESAHCQCTVLPGFGQHVLDDVLKVMAKKTPHKFAESFDPDLDSEMVCLGKAMVSWLCSPEPVRV